MLNKMIKKNQSFLTLLIFHFLFACNNLLYNNNIKKKSKINLSTNNSCTFVKMPFIQNQRNQLYNHMLKILRLSDFAFLIELIRFHFLTA